MKNVPNILTIFRIILIPVFVWAFLGLGSIWLACVIYVVAGGTDLLDGYIARKYNATSKLGTVLDPLADKLMQLTVTATLAISGLAFMWVVFGILLFKEVLMIAGGAVLLGRKDITVPAVWYGKAYSAVLFVVILIIIIWRDVISVNFEITLVAVSVVMGILAGVGYLIKFKKLLNSEY